MRYGIVVFFVFAMVVVGGCGSTKQAASTTAAKPPPNAVEIGRPFPVKSVTYRTELLGSNGSPKGSPGASALAILVIKASSLELCWQFSQLKNVTAPTRARIYRSLAGGPGVGGLGILLGAEYRPEGCTREPEGFLALLGKVPQNFFLSIDNAAFPHGAVRGRP